MTTIVIILAVVATAAVVAWFFLARKFPERASRHDDEPAVGANTHRSVGRSVAERPAGPDAESMDASRPGGATPPPPPPPDTGGPPSDDAPERRFRCMPRPEQGIEVTEQPTDGNALRPAGVSHEGARSPPT